MIDGVQHEVYNAAHVTSKDGFPETELTLKTAAQEREIIDDKGTKSSSHVLITGRLPGRT